MALSVLKSQGPWLTPERSGIITAAECRKIENGLRAIEQEVESGEFKWDRTLEDVHMEH